jgi:hypothetical protein
MKRMLGTWGSKLQIALLPSWLCRFAVLLPSFCHPFAILLPILLLILLLILAQDGSVMYDLNLKKGVPAERLRKSHVEYTVLASSAAFQPGSAALKALVLRETFW